MKVKLTWRTLDRQRLFYDGGTSNEKEKRATTCWENVSLDFLLDKERYYEKDES